MIAAAVLRHAEGQQVPALQPLPSFTAVRARASAASISALSVDGRMLHTLAARSAVVSSLVTFREREDPLPGGGEFLVLPEPRLESGDLQREYRVLRIGGGRSRQKRERLARAAGGLRGRGQLGQQGVVGRKTPDIAWFELSQQDGIHLQRVVGGGIRIQT